MAKGDLWTSSQRQAWDYVKAAEGSGLNQSEALREYRAGGGAIRTSDWGMLWHRYDEGAAQWDRLYQFRSNDTVPESLFNPVNINYAEKYVMTFKATVRDENGNLVHDVYRQVESNERLTLAQWQSAATEALLEDPSQFSTGVVDLAELEFWERQESSM